MFSLICGSWTYKLNVYIEAHTHVYNIYIYLYLYTHTHSDRDNKIQLVKPSGGRKKENVRE
jgi:hypothetical protein